LLSDTRFSNWQSVDAAKPAPGTSATTSSPPQQFPRSIRIERPHDDYRLDLQIAKITLNDDIPLDRFKLEQPPSSELIRVGESPEEKQSSQGAKP
jgi:outer membrane lipoprotein-sorting protein